MTLLRVAEPQEERAHRLEREFQAVLDAAVDAVVLFDHEGRIELLNHAGERMFGYNEQEVIGLKVNILLPEPYRSQHDDHLRHYIEAGEPRIIGIGRELLAKRRDGSEFSAELAVGRVKGTEPPRFVGFIRDITVRRNAEEALRRSEAQLTIAQEIANLGNYVVHFDGKFEDYWSPHLYRVLGRRYGEPYIAVYEYLEPMVHPADRARWQQARTELDATGRQMDIEYRVIHPDGSLRYVHHLAQTTRAADGRPLRQVGTLHDITDRRRAEDEARQIQQVVLNLVRNSIDAMIEVPEARREIVLRTLVDSEGDVEFMVADRGIGVDATTMAELFNPFFTTKPGGTGLGLSISRSIVRAHGGKLWCGANPGGGARFFFTLPAVPTSVGS